MPTCKGRGRFGNVLSIDPCPHCGARSWFITVGTSSNGRVLIVAHSDRGENIRIISARKTTLRERKHYEEENWGTETN
jgi:hypothetical protein